jgi:hypothetical protein
MGAVERRSRRTVYGHLFDSDLDDLALRLDGARTSGGLRDEESDADDQEGRRDHGVRGAPGRIRTFDRRIRSPML